MADNWLVPLSIGACALFAVAILWKLPQWQVRRVQDLAPKEHFDRVNEARKTLATILGGLAFLVGGFFTWQNLKVAQENLKVSQEGQITDRFSKAIQQPGAVDAKSGQKELEVRLGGIYALERIADESERDYWPIIEVLCTYVRVNAPAPNEGEHGLSEQQKPKEAAQNGQASASDIHPAADIQAILTVLSRRKRRYERPDDQVLDLSHTDLRGADLSELHLEKADLSGACVKKTRNRRAVRKMEVDPPEPPCRRRLQTAISCCGPMTMVVNVMVKRRDSPITSSKDGRDECKRSADEASKGS